MYLPSIRPDLSLSWAWCGPVLSDVCCSAVIRILLWGLKGILTKIEGLLRVGALALRTNKAFTGNAEELSAKRKNYLALSQEDFATKKRFHPLFAFPAQKSSALSLYLVAWWHSNLLDCKNQVCKLSVAFFKCVCWGWHIDQHYHYCVIFMHCRKHFA